MSFLSPGFTIHRAFNMIYGDLGVTGCTDGPVWTQRGSIASAVWRSTIFGNTPKRLVALGNSGATATAAFSDDFGVTWTPAATPPPFTGGNTARPNCLAFGNSIWVAVDNFNTVARSLDNGNTWAAAATQQTFALWFGTANFVFATLSSTVIFTSGDGVTLTPRNLGGTTGATNLQGASNGAGVHILVQAGTIATFRSIDDGVSWAPGGNLPNILPFTASGASSLATNGAGTWVATSPDGATLTPFAYSTDNGVTWQASNAIPNPPVGCTWGNVIYAQGKFLAFTSVNNGAFSLIVNSSDGITWSTPAHVATWPAGTAFTITHEAVAFDGATHYAIVPATAAANVVTQTGTC